MSLPISLRLHSVLLLTFLTLAACASEPASAPVPAPEATPLDDDRKGHVHQAPHGGALVEIGEEFAHVEFVFDAGSGKLTAYVLDGEAESAVRIRQAEIEVQIQSPALTRQLKAVANVLTGETAGDSSEFTLDIPELKNAKAFDGTIRRISVKGSDFENINFNFPKGSEE